MSNESVWQVARSWVDVGSFHARLVMKFMIFTASVQNILDYLCVKHDKTGISCFISSDNAYRLWQHCYCSKTYLRHTWTLNGTCVSRLHFFLHFLCFPLYAVNGYQTSLTYGFALCSLHMQLSVDQSIRKKQSCQELRSWMSEYVLMLPRFCCV
jgi:hypothetical protein